MRGSLLVPVSTLQVALNEGRKSSFLLFLSILEGVEGKTVSINILSNSVL